MLRGRRMLPTVPRQRPDEGPGLVCGQARDPVGKAARFRDGEGNVLTVTQIDYEH
jgi:hypothetical protein